MTLNRKITLSILITSLAVLLLSLALVMISVYGEFEREIETQLREKTRIAAIGLEADGPDFFASIPSNSTRYTWISPDGDVIYDTEADALVMENHSGREEVREAVETGYGASSRYSETLLQKYYYSAVRLSDGSVIRLSEAGSSVFKLILGTVNPAIIILALAAVISVVVARRLSESIVKPLNALNLDDPLSNEGYDELSPLLLKIDEQHRQIESQLSELRRISEEFETLTGSMSEGLLLLNESSKIMSLNRAARSILSAPVDCIGEHILTVNRSTDLLDLIDKAAKEGSAEEILTFQNRHYRTDVTRVESEGRGAGFVVLFFDVTEREDAESIRREFTANVSHELKTPLHTISGCSELLANGLVKAADQKAFAEQIHSEAARLITLVDDIIRLSHLDEGAFAAKLTEFSLKSIAEAIKKDLAGAAVKNNIAVKVEGDDVRITSEEGLVTSVIYNLVDNAIKYNKPSGTVTIRSRKDASSAYVEVEDTGIGISEEDQKRVFERFYRVDKSRSKEIGGTGLGLSIVKHTAANLGGDVSVKSILGVGSVFTVRFPLV